MERTAILIIINILGVLIIMIAGVFLLTRGYRKKCEINELDEIDGHDFEY